MKISNYLNENLIKLELESKTKDEAIKELGVLMEGLEDITDHNGFLKDVFAREQYASTGIGNEVGIPHARTDNVKKFVISFGRSKEGIEFDSIDGKKVKLIFLMGTPKDTLDHYLQILAHLTRLLKKVNFRDSLNDASTAGDIIELFKSAEK